MFKWVLNTPLISSKYSWQNFQKTLRASFSIFFSYFIKWERIFLQHRLLLYGKDTFLCGFAICDTFFFMYWYSNCLFTRCMHSSCSNSFADYICHVLQNCCRREGSSISWNKNWWDVTKLTFTCSKLTIETLEKDVKYVQC